MATLKLGFYFETEKQNAELAVDGFYFTRKRINRISDHALLIEKDQAWTGYYHNAMIQKTFYQHLEDIVIVNQ